MAEIWGIVLASAASGYLDSRSAEKESEKDYKRTKEQIAQEAAEGRTTDLYRMQIGDYYNQITKQRKRDARRAHFSGYSRKPQPAGYTVAPLVGEAPPPPPVSNPNAQPAQTRVGSALQGARR